MSAQEINFELLKIRATLICFFESRRLPKSSPKLNMGEGKRPTENRKFEIMPEIKEERMMLKDCV